MPIYTQDKRNAQADVTWGLRVDRAAALVTAATVNLFTIVGGRVLLTGLLGEISVAIAATATTLQITSLRTDVTTPVATVLCIASADIQSMAPGRMFTLPAAVGSALTISVGSSAALMNAVRYVLPVGGLRLVGSAAPATGTVKWSVWYWPIDDGAYMAAA
jgi:hypothetical protein